MEQKPIGKICSDENGFRIVLEKEYIPGLMNLSGFSHMNVLWWFDRCDYAASRKKLTVQKPYMDGPDYLGTFATRSPERPNPLGLTCAEITFLDEENGVIGLAYMDAADDSPVLDLKPYTPSLDRVEKPQVPSWCSRWPKNIESSGDFDWSTVFNF